MDLYMKKSLYLAEDEETLYLGSTLNLAKTFTTENEALQFVERRAKELEKFRTNFFIANLIIEHKASSYIGYFSSDKPRY